MGQPTCVCIIHHCSKCHYAYFNVFRPYKSRVFGLLVKMVIKTPDFHSRRCGFDISFFSPAPTIQWRWLKWLFSCLLCGRYGFNSWLLAPVFNFNQVPTINKHLWSKPVDKRHSLFLSLSLCHSRSCKSSQLTTKWKCAVFLTWQIQMSITHV